MGMSWVALVSGKGIQAKTSWHCSKGTEDYSELHVFLWPRYNLSGKQAVRLSP